MEKEIRTSPTNALSFFLKKKPILKEISVQSRLLSLIIIFVFLCSCDGMMQIRNNVFIKHNLNSQTYYSKYSGECDVYFNLLQIKGVAFNPDPSKNIYKRKVEVVDGLLDLTEITWSKESKYMIHLKCDGYKEITKIFNFPSIEPSYFFFELEKEN